MLAYYKSCNPVPLRIYPYFMWRWYPSFKPQRERHSSTSKWLVKWLCNVSTCSIDFKLQYPMWREFFRDGLAKWHNCLRSNLLICPVFVCGSVLIHTHVCFLLLWGNSHWCNSPKQVKQKGLWHSEKEKKNYKNNNSKTLLLFLHPDPNHRIVLINHH